MAIVKDNDNLMGVDTVTYNRIANTGALINGSNNITLVCQKFSSEEYRQENPNDFKPFNINVELSNEELKVIWDIIYTAGNRIIEGEKA